MSDASTIIVLMPEEGESWNVFVRRIGETKEDALVVLTGREDELVEQPELRGVLLKECKKHEKRVKIATKLPSLAAEAREMELTVLDRTKDVRTALKGHPKLEEVLRVFSPHLWRQQLASQLQHIGLLSVPRLRIYVLSALSAGLFFFVFFRLLPSAEVRILPRQEPVSQTMNVYLVQSGATSGLSPRVRTMPLLPIAVSMRRSATYDHISKEFIGNSSMISLTISNTAAEQYSFRTGTRFTNQAGMVFRIQESAVIPAGKQVTVRAKADDTDLYGQIIGDRGNVPAGLKWEIPGLSPAERKKIYAENKEPAKGGTTAHRTVLKKEDIDLARKKLEIELTNSAKQQLAEVVQERAAWRFRDADALVAVDLGEGADPWRQDVRAAQQLLDLIHRRRLVVDVDLVRRGDADGDLARLRGGAVDLGQADLGARLDHCRAADHEDDQQHQEDVGQRRDVDLRHDRRPAALLQATERHAPGGRCGWRRGRGARRWSAPPRCVRRESGSSCRK